MSDKAPIFIISNPPYGTVIFDLDSVVTKTAKIHAAVWKQLFDEYLKQRRKSQDKALQPFDPDTDYHRYVDGKPRYEGVKSFLDSRGIELPYGAPDDPIEKETVCGLGNRKNELFQEYLKKHSVETYGSTLDLIHHLKSHGFKMAIVSSSENCVTVLKAAGIADLFDTKVDGVDAEELDLEGKPAPDIFLEAARRLAVDPEHTVIVEDAIAGVEAGKRGGFGCVIGVERAGQASTLKEGGADVVVTDLSQVAVKSGKSTSKANTEDLPSALESTEEIRRRIKGKRVAVFLDYDGTLTPIVQRPEQAVLSNDIRDAVRKLACQCTVAVVSGRDLRDVRQRVGIEEVFYAGSHGFDIAGPEGRQVESQQGTDFLPVLDRAERTLADRLQEIDGARVERKKFSIAVHYREVREARVEAVEDIVDQALADYPELRKSSGKKVYELQPKIDWHKGKALLWLLEVLGLNQPDVLPIYVGDDVTDEDAFAVLRDRGIGIVVAEGSQPTAARYTLEDPTHVLYFLRALTSMIEGGT